MADRLEDLLRTCTVRVTGGPMPGAGFFVAPGRVLTCVHVIGDADALTVGWDRDGQRPAEVPVSARVAVLAGGGRPIPALARDYPDIAVLAVDGLDGHPCVSIDPEWPAQEDTFQLFGYPREGDSVLLTPARLTYRGTKGTAPATFLDLASDRIKGGMSGAAVLNLRTGGVCGVVVASKDTTWPDGALAIPWSAVDTDLAQVLAASEAFHRTDRRWHAAVVGRRDRLRFRLPWVVDHFTGRDDLLARLDAALSQGGTGVITQAVSGLGGVGKTQLAAVYVAAHRDEYDIAAWIRAEDGGTADLADLAVALALPVAGRTPPERAADALAYLAGTGRRWLLVLDNVPGPAALAGLPTSGQGRVLVTSRHRGGYGAFGAELPVDVFDPDTARDYLLFRTGRSDAEADDADAVALALGYLPLALAHAGGYCAADPGVPFREYLGLFTDLPSQDLFDTSPAIFYQHTVAATWHPSVTAAAARAPLARPVLDMAAFLAPDEIPRSFFQVLAGDSAAGRKSLADALAVLHGYSLITLTGSRLSIHRLLQKVIRDQITGTAQQDAIRLAVTAVEDVLPKQPELPAAWPQWQELLPHVLTLAGIDAVATTAATRLVPVLISTCDFLHYAGSMPAALDLVTRGHVIAGTCLGPDHPGTLMLHGHLGALHDEAGRYADALSVHEQVTAGYERVLGADHPDTLTARSNLAIAYLRTDRTSEAITVLEQVAASSERVRGPGHRDTLIARANLAECYRTVGRLDEAITLQEEIAADRERDLGSDHPATLNARSNLGVFYQTAGRTAEAIIIKEQVAADRERILGPDHPSTHHARANLAISYDADGRTDEAITLLEQALTSLDRTLGPDNPTSIHGRADLTRWRTQREK